jgi:hypothetical protein
MREKCSVDGCKNDSDVGYYDKFLCEKHWNKFADYPSDKIKEILKIKTKKSDISNDQEESLLKEHQ